MYGGVRNANSGYGSLRGFFCAFERGVVRACTLFSSVAGWLNIRCCIFVCLLCDSKIPEGMSFNIARAVLERFKV